MGERSCDFSNDLSPSAAFFDSETSFLDCQKGCDKAAVFEGSTTASSPQLTYREDLASEENHCFRRSHVRQLSTQTADGFDMDLQELEVTPWSLPAGVPLPGLDGTAMQQPMLYDIPGVAPVLQSVTIAATPAISTPPLIAQEQPMFLSTSPISVPMGACCMPGVWSGLTPEASVVDLAARAYERGVAAGVAQAAFAKVL